MWKSNIENLFINVTKISISIFLGNCWKNSICSHVQNDEYHAAMPHRYFCFYRKVNKWSKWLANEKWVFLLFFNTFISIAIIGCFPLHCTVFHLSPYLTVFNDDLLYYSAGITTFTGWYGFFFSVNIHDY